MVSTDGRTDRRTDTEGYNIIPRHTLVAGYKNQYLSAEHVSRTPEYWGYMGSTQSISRTIQPIAMKFSQNVDNI